MESDRPRMIGTMFTLREAAALVRCSANTLKAAILRGELEAKDVGSGRRRYWRIARLALQRWLGLDGSTA